MSDFIQRNPKLFIAALAALLFIPFLGGVHLFDWDEINFAEISREMIASGDYLRPQIGFQPFYEKPPLFIWMQAAAMQLFGVGEFAARLPNALCGIATLLLLFRTGSKLGGRRMGWLWVAFYAGSILPHLYFRSGIIDPWFNLFIFLGIYRFWEAAREPQRPGRQLFIAGLSLGAAVLAKGPVAWLIAGLCIAAYSLWQGRLPLKRPGSWLLFAGATLLLPLLWFGMVVLLDGPEFVVEFVRYQVRLLLTPDAGHRGFPGFHVVVLLLGCFPASLFALPAFRRKEKENTATENFRKWMLVLFWVVLVLFSLVRTKIVHYSSLCYFPLTFLAAYYVHFLLRQKAALPGWLRIGTVAMALIYASATALLPWLGQHPELLLPHLKDPFAAANLQAEVDWSSPLNYLPATLLFLSLISFFSSLRNGKTGPAILGLLVGTALFVQTGLYCFIGKIEAYSQRAAVEFCESLATQDVYIKAVGYKSYVPFFYGKADPGGNPKRHDQNWLLTGPIDRDAWLLTKIHRADELRAFPELEEMGSKNGFVFFRRKKESTAKRPNSG